jgi:hypothetical protein
MTIQGSPQQNIEHKAYTTHTYNTPHTAYTKHPSNSLRAVIIELFGVDEGLLP